MTHDRHAREQRPGSFVATTGQNPWPPVGRSAGRRWADLGGPWQPGYPKTERHSSWPIDSWARMATTPRGAAA